MLADIKLDTLSGLLAMGFRYVAEITRFSNSTKLRIEFIFSNSAELTIEFAPKVVRRSDHPVNRKLWLEFSTIFCPFYPAREGLRSPVSAFSAALLISDA